MLRIILAVILDAFAGYQTQSRLFGEPGEGQKYFPIGLVGIKICNQSRGQGLPKMGMPQFVDLTPQKHYREFRVRSDVLNRCVAGHWDPGR